MAHPPDTILDFLCGHFPHIGKDLWLKRVVSGYVRTSSGAIDPGTPYQAGQLVFYHRSVEVEVRIPFEETILHEGEHLIVVDKPHFLPVTPAGDVVNECLLFRLQRRTGLNDLAPVHRLDRDTAGLVLFCKRKADRAAYAGLFAAGQVERKYLAVAEVGSEKIAVQGREWWIEDRLQPEPGSFRVIRVPGEVNARTRIELREVREGLGLFGLQPLTGKKHQLRLHMRSLGFPILNDPFYPELARAGSPDFSRPMQLLASDLVFRDPLTGETSHFRSQQRLIRWN